MEDMAQCDRVLMTPRFSVVEQENPYLRPEHEVDLSFIAPPPDQGEPLLKASVCFTLSGRGTRYSTGFQVMCLMACCLNLLIL